MRRQRTNQVVRKAAHPSAQIATATPGSASASGRAAGRPDEAPSVSASWENGWLTASIKTGASANGTIATVRHVTCPPIATSAAKGTRNFIDAANQIQ